VAPATGLTVTALEERGALQVLTTATKGDRAAQFIWAMMMNCSDEIASKMKRCGLLVLTESGLRVGGWPHGTNRLLGEAVEALP
jgi:hypothetical protein